MPCGVSKRALAVFLILAGAVTSIAAVRYRDVIYTAPCSCQNNHGVARWRAKTDASDPPKDAAQIQPITPSEICAWRGPGIVPRGGPRTGNELRWFALTGRAISVQAENDADIHMVLVNAHDHQPGKVVVEIPLGPRWCELRKTAFAWTDATFPFTANWQHSPFRTTKHPVITVIGKAFYDIDHAGKDWRNNRRPREKDKAVWEIHPVMRMEVQQAAEPNEPVEEETPQPEEEEMPGATVAASTPTVAPSTPPAAATIVTILQPIKIAIPYGETVIPAGMKLPVIRRDATTVQVRYLDELRTIPISATDLR